MSARTSFPSAAASRRSSPTRSRWAGFDDVVTAAQRRLAARAQVVEQPTDLARLQALVPGVVHHHDGCAIARPEAFHFDQGEGAARIRFARLDRQLAANLLGDALGAVQRAR